MDKPVDVTDFVADIFYVDVGRYLWQCDIIIHKYKWQNDGY